MDKKLRILITSGIFPPDIGGPARVIEQMTRELHQKGFEVKILAFGEKSEQNYPFLVEKISCLKAGGAHSLLAKFRFALALYRLAREVDLIYTYDLYTAGFLSWLLGKKMLGKKLVVRFAGDSAWESAFNQRLTQDDIITFQKKHYGFKIWRMKKMRGWILKGADKVVAVSYFIKNLAIKIGAPAEKIKVIYNSVDFIEIKNLDERTRELRHQWGLTGGKVLVTGGRLVTWKGIDGLIEVVSELKERSESSSLKLLIIGDGPDRKRLEKIVEDKKLASEVVFTDRVPLDKIVYYYNLADIFILNSKYEGLSHMLLEALNLGRPVIASNCGGNPEVIQDGKNGLLVEYNNVEQLKLAIKRMLMEPYWQSIEHKKICQASLEKFNWQNVIDQTIKVFEELTKNLSFPRKRESRY